MTAPDAPVPGLVADLFRHTYGRVVAALVTRLGPGRLDLAEDVTQDALLGALRSWPFRGVPSDPAAWLYRTAWNRALDRLRHDATARRLEERVAEALGEGGGDDLSGDQLALLATCAALPLPGDAVVPLALSVVAGLSAREISRALLLDEATVAQRLVRAKRRLRAEPGLVALRADGAALAGALPVALETVYLVFSEGFSPSRGDDPIRLDLVAEGLRFAEALAAHPATAGSATHALAALCQFLAARLPARADGGQVILLADQDRSRWDQRRIAAGCRHLQAAIGGDPLTRFHLEAEIAALHTLAPTYAATDWAAIVAAYDKLLLHHDSPVVRLNRAIALSEWRGVAAGLEAIAALADVAELARSPWFHAARGRLLAADGQVAAASAAYTAARRLTEATPALAFLDRQLAALGRVSG